jgi:alpha-glucosidase (family GH31 glycosyl hydrolase)
MSAQVYTSGDVDGIYGGSNETYVRDLQWKCFLPTVMTMSGWASFDKQPWRRGEPWTSINRRYLKLKVRLTPYQYSLAHEAATTGMPPVRPLLLHYPEDPVTWDNTTQYQFLSGPAFLVAPVYMDNVTRDGIYLPKDTWIDYWTGETFAGPTTLNKYPAPIDTLPVFVREGSIVPMWPEMNFFYESAHDPLTFDVYPSSSASAKSKFELYEGETASSFCVWMNVNIWNCC